MKARPVNLVNTQLRANVALGSKNLGIATRLFMSANDPQTDRKSGQHPEPDLHAAGMTGRYPHQRRHRTPAPGPATGAVTGTSTRIHGSPPAVIQKPQRTWIRSAAGTPCSNAATPSGVVGAIIKINRAKAQEETNDRFNN